jgi:hypothetical protein
MRIATLSPFDDLAGLVAPAKKENVRGVFTTDWGKKKREISQTFDCAETLREVVASGRLSGLRCCLPRKWPGFDPQSRPELR